MYGYVSGRSKCENPIFVGWQLFFSILNFKNVKKKTPQSHHRNRIAVLRAQYISRTIARIKETIPVVEKVYIYTYQSPAMASIINIPTRYATFLSSLLLYLYFSGRRWPWNYCRPNVSSIVLLHQFVINHRSPAATTNIIKGEDVFPNCLLWIIDLLIPVCG